MDVLMVVTPLVAEAAKADVMGLAKTHAKGANTLVPAVAKIAVEKLANIQAAVNTSL